PVEQQRGALALANGTVYVPLGGLYGDCGDYHGYVIGYRTTGSGPMVYKTEDTEAGIWAASELSVIPGGDILASVGNSARTSAAHLGHVGGQLSSMGGCAAYGGTAVYRSVVFTPCSDGLAAIKVVGTHLSMLWKAPGNITGSPIYGGGAVWSLDQNAGVLYGL